MSAILVSYLKVSLKRFKPREVIIQIGDNDVERSGSVTVTNIITISRMATCNIH